MSNTNNEASFEQKPATTELKKQVRSNLLIYNTASLLFLIYLILLQLT